MRVAWRPKEVRAKEETELQSLSHSRTLRLSETTLEDDLLLLSIESESESEEQKNGSLQVGVVVLM